MHKKDYIKAAEIVRVHYEKQYPIRAFIIEGAFVRLFMSDNSRFDEKKFRDACKGK